MSKKNDSKLSKKNDSKLSKDNDSKLSKDNELKKQWQELWPLAMKLWSKYTRLPEPLWCTTKAQMKAAGLTGSFAMIRLTDLQVVIGLNQVNEMNLEKFALQIMAHEAGHHIYAPANLRDNARLLARMQSALPGVENYAPLVANLYCDLLINDRLEREFEIDMISVYKALKNDEKEPKLWLLYMRIYEMLWQLPQQTLTDSPPDSKTQIDADLGARLIRVYQDQWLDGAGRFACLFLPYIEKELENTRTLLKSIPPWLDTINAGDGATIPDGLIELDDDELNGSIHPSEDPALNGLFNDSEGDDGSDLQDGDGSNNNSASSNGNKKAIHHRNPRQYVDLIKSSGVHISEKELLISYYRERALPYIVAFPVVETKHASDPLPEGLDIWETNAPVSAIDWTETMVKSPVVIPGVTTVQRQYGQTTGSSVDKVPVDLYIGIDCSGSMPNPAMSVSYSVIAGSIMTLSALRAKADVMVCLSGETPGKYSETNGFLNNEKEIMTILTGYIGTGYAFGVQRLNDTFLKEGGKGQGERKNKKKKTHLVILSDQDWFAMLDSDPRGWEIAEEAARIAGGGATVCLNLYNSNYYKEKIALLEDIGWNVYLISSMDDVIEFARKFSKVNYERIAGKH